MKLPYIKIFVEDLELLLKTLPCDHVILLFEMLKKIANDEDPDISIPKESLYAFEDQKQKLLRMKAKYETKCTTNAINGAKGGKAKAKKQKEEEEEEEGEEKTEDKETEKKPPMTQTAFVAKAKDLLRFYGEGGKNMPLYRFNETGIKEAYMEFENDGWIYCDYRIETEDNLLGAFLAYSVVEQKQQRAEEIVRAFAGMTPLFSPPHFANIFLSYNVFTKSYDLSEYHGSVYKDAQKAVKFYTDNIIYKQ